MIIKNDRWIAALQAPSNFSIDVLLVSGLDLELTKRFTPHFHTMRHVIGPAFSRFLDCEIEPDRFGRIQLDITNVFYKLLVPKVMYSDRGRI